MPRAPRVHVEEGLYFICTKGDHGRPLFGDDADRWQYIGLLEKYKSQFSFKLFSYVLIADLIHLLIELAKGTTISEIMHAINSSYTKYFNSRYGRRGHLFRERFTSIIAEKNTYLTQLTRYIHLMPSKANLVNNPEDYKWSSYQYYIGKKQEDPLGIREDSKEVMADFSADAGQQVNLYKEFVKSAKDIDLEQMKKKIERSKILGSKEFMEEIKMQVKEEETKKEKELMEKPAHKIFMRVSVLVVAVLAIFVVYIYTSNMMLGKKLEKQGIEYKEKLVTETETLRKDLEQKHKADMVSYRAVSKRLELEKDRIKELEAKLGEK